MEPENAKDPDDPGYEWPPDLDEAVSEATKYHIQIAFTLEHADADFATAAARRYPKVRLWEVGKTGSYATTLGHVYTALKARSRQNKVIANPGSRRRRRRSSTCSATRPWPSRSCRTSTSSTRPSRRTS